MSEIVKCNSCGSSNQLPFGKNSMFCAYCGGMVEKELESKSFSYPTIIKSELKELDFKETEWYEDIEIEQQATISYGQMSNRMPSSYIKNIEHYRTNDGYNVVIIYAKKRMGENYYTEVKKTEFVPFEYDYKNFTSKLDVSSLNINSFSDLLKFYGITELKDITDLIIDNNNISNWTGIENLKNLKTLSIKNNKIKKLPYEWVLYKNESYEINEIHLENNSIEEIPVEYPFLQDVKIYLKDNPLNVIPEKVKFSENNVVKEYIVHLSEIKVLTLQLIDNRKYCTKCNSVITKITYDNNNGCCKKCSKGKCFIATATLGSYEHPEVLILRRFRDEWILTKEWGYGFVNWYYQNGAIIASFIEKSSTLKKISYWLIVKPLGSIANKLLK